MANSQTCPFCQHIFFLDKSTYQIYQNRFPIGHNQVGYTYDEKYSFDVHLYRCPNCQKIFSAAQYTGSALPHQSVHIFPISAAKRFPDYVPLSIRQDYEEACAIVLLSPKASATLARRCIQGMIHDFWNIHEKNLNAEITALKDKIQPSLWNAIDALRKIGNIGAHMEHDINTIVDIEPQEAEKLIKLIELLIKEWYIQRHEQEQLLADIISISDDKQQQRN